MLVAKEYFQNKLRGEDLNNKYNIESIEMK